MTIPPRTLGALALILTACPGGGADDSDDGDADEADEGGTDEGGGDTGDEPCDAEGRYLLEDLGGPTVALAVSGDRVAYVRRDDAGALTVIHLIGTDGAEATTLHTSAAGARVFSIAWAGDDVIFLESPGTSDPSQLYRISASGGTASLVGTGTFSGTERLLGTEDGIAYVMTGGPATVDAIDLASGSVERVGQASSTGTPLHPVLFDGEIMFYAGAGNDAAVYRLQTSDRDAEASPLGSIGTEPACSFPLGGLTGTADKIVCGFVDVVTFDRPDGAGPDVIFDGDIVDGVNTVVGASGDDVYLIETGDGSTDVAIKTVSISGGDLTPLACDARKVSWQVVDASFPNQVEYQIAVGDSDIVWVEERREDTASPATFALRAASR